jgi:hypothetical protein
MASTLDAQYAPHIIVFQRTASKARYLFRTDGHVREGTLDDFVPELNCPSTWCVRQNTPTHYLTFEHRGTWVFICVCAYAVVSDVIMGCRCLACAWITSTSQ